jgi:hypothetical protein
MLINNLFIAGPVKRFAVFNYSVYEGLLLGPDRALPVGVSSSEGSLNSDGGRPPSCCMIMKARCLDLGAFSSLRAWCSMEMGDRDDAGVKVKGTGCWGVPPDVVSACVD